MTASPKMIVSSAELQFKSLVTYVLYLIEVQWKAVSESILYYTYDIFDLAFTR